MFGLVLVKGEKVGGFFAKVNSTNTVNFTVFVLLTLNVILCIGLELKVTIMPFDILISGKTVLINNTLLGF